MPVLKYDETPAEVVRDGFERRIIHTDNLMTVVIDFTDGPWDTPLPYHAHPHEQTSYVVAGEIIFFCEGELDQHLKAGDAFYITSGKKHTIQLLTPSVRLIDNFSPIREDFLQ